jgi:hypothetical protein
MLLRLAIEIRLEGLGISFIDNTPKELLYLSLYDLELSYS